MPSEIHRRGSNSTPDFEDALSSPAFKLREPRNVRLDEMLALLDFVEILAAADGLRRMPNIARSRVPIGLDGLNARSSLSALNEAVFAAIMLSPQFTCRTARALVPALYYLSIGTLGSSSKKSAAEN